MGCSESKPSQGNGRAEAEVIISSNGNGLQETEPAKTKATDNSLQDVNPIQLNSTHGSVKRPEESNIMKPLRARPSGLENAWGNTRVVNENLENTFNKPQVQKVDDFGSEYGKDGVDLASSHVQSGQDAEKFVSNSLGARTSPDGTYSADYNERLNHERPGIHKKESDESFDPSKLIDIEKFKAANAPGKQVQTTTAKPELSNFDVNHNVLDVSRKAASNDVERPLNYNEIYDDDEKQLIASIENDFETALPGSVF